MHLIFFGPPGVGKGTQAQVIAKKLNLAHVSTGDILRSEVKKKTPLGLKAKSYMDKGVLVPDDLIIEMVRHRLTQPDCKNGFILDGFPRTLAQAQSLDKMLSEEGMKIDRVINFTLSEEEIVNRLTNRRMCSQCNRIYNLLLDKLEDAAKCPACGGELYQRSDDRPEVIKKRLEVYRKETEPVLEYYRKKGILVTIDVSGSVSEVTNSLVSVLERDY